MSTTDAEERVKKIRKRRAAVTDHAVDASAHPLFRRITKCQVQNFPTFAAPDSPPVAYVADMEDAKFYAHAPADIDYLLSLLPAATGEVSTPSADDAENQKGVAAQQTPSGERDNG